MDGHDSLTAARAPQVRAWLLDMLPVAPDWKTAGALEAARVEAGIGKRALRTARERLLADGAIEKGRDGFQGPFRYRRAERAAVAESEAAPDPEAAGVRAVPEAPEAPERFAVTLALDRLAKDCGYSLDSVNLTPAPGSPGSALNGP